MQRIQSFEPYCEGICLQNRSCEDRYCIRRLTKCDYFAVFDGHGKGNKRGEMLDGKHVVLYLKDHLADYIEDLTVRMKLQNTRDYLLLMSAIKELFIEIDELLYNENCIAGSTCNMVLIFPDIIIQCNLGDSRSLIYLDTGRIISETVDHKPLREKRRIEQCGGFVSCNENSDTPRVNGSLAVSRSFGDFDLKMVDGRYSCNGPVSAIPDFWYVKRRDGIQLNIILGTDGLFDAYPSSTVVNKLVRGYTVEDLAVEGSKINGSDDLTFLYTVA